MAGSLCVGRTLLSIAFDFGVEEAASPKLEDNHQEEQQRTGVFAPHLGYPLLVEEG